MMITARYGVRAAAVRTSLRGLAADTAVTVAATAAASAMMATQTFVT